MVATRVHAFKRWQAGHTKGRARADQRGLWRYHPTRHMFEVFAEGTAIRGVDFDDHGQAFCTACVIPHLYHMIQGARYQRQRASILIRTHTPIFKRLPTTALCWRYGRTLATAARAMRRWACARRCDDLPGGAWPDEYRHTILMNNIHGQRANQDILERQGSGFVGHHGKDFLLTGDLASQMLNFRYGPDGQVYINDWYDMNACHHTNAEGHDRTNGRIYKVSYGKVEHKSIDLKKLSDGEWPNWCWKRMIGTFDNHGEFCRSVPWPAKSTKRRAIANRDCDHEFR